MFGRLIQFNEFRMNEIGEIGDWMEVPGNDSRDDG
jgi:hypothetical protein